MNKESPLKSTSDTKEVQISTIQDDAPKLPDRFTLKCKRSLYDKMQGWTDACPVEAGGMMAVRLVGKGIFEVVDTFLDRQIASAAYLEIEPKSLNKRRHGYLKAWGDCKVERDKAVMEGDFEKFIALDKELEKKKDDMKLLRGEWHSHVNFNTFLSGTDVATALRLCRNDPYVIMLVLNKHKKYYLEAYVRSPFPYQIRGNFEVYNDTEEEKEPEIKIEEPALTPEQVSLLPEIEARYGKDAKDAFREMVLNDMKEDAEHKVFEAKQEKLKEVHEQYKREIDEKVFSPSEYEIDLDTQEIVKKKVTTYTPSTNYDFNYGYEDRYPYPRDYRDRFGTGLTTSANTETAGLDERSSKIFPKDIIQKIIGI